jgi:DNA-directed RNA polymerase subunit D
LQEEGRKKRKESLTKMDVKMISQNKDRGEVTFLLKDATPAYANTLRRLMIDEVPTMAIEEIEFSKNNSILFDEMIAHRMGMIPLKTDLKSYNVPEECKCEGKGCNRCQLKLVLKTQKNDTIYASELKSKDPAIKPVYPEMPIVKLLKGQSLELEATAVLGKGKIHAKWSPGHVYFKYKPVVEITGDVKNPEGIIEVDHNNIFELKDKKLIVNKDRVLDCDLSVDFSQIDKNVKVHGNPNEFVFTIESFGQLTPKEMMVEAVRILDEQLDKFIEELKKSQ